MPNRFIPSVKVLVHLLCLVPFVLLVYSYTSGRMALQADPVLEITHFTGNWALYMLLISLAVTPVRRLLPRLSNLIRFRRMLGLYAFFYASLHLSTYIFLFSGYDLPTAWNSLRQGHPGALWTQWLAVWPTVLDDLKERRFIQVGLLAWLILLALTLTSPKFVLRAMGGKNWQRLHSLVYVAAIAACIHYWWLVKRGNMQPLVDTLILTGLLLARLMWAWNKKQKQGKTVRATKLQPTG
jgi:sulfoxide reductase heme-binding subunit YedZ